MIPRPCDIYAVTIGAMALQKGKMPKAVKYMGQRVSLSYNGGFCKCGHLQASSTTADDGLTFNFLNFDFKSVDGFEPLFDKLLKTAVAINNYASITISIDEDDLQ